MLKQTKFGIVIAIALLLILFGIISLFFFLSWVNLVIDTQIPLQKGSLTIDWWAKPPVHPVMKVYVYNVTNADGFLNDGEKPQLEELGPYVYVETWEKVNLKFNSNATVTFNQRKVFHFDRSQSAGDEDDMVVVPNIPMLSATSQSKNAARFLRLAMASIMDILKVKPFVEVSVGQLLWGYEDPLLKLAKDVVTKDQKLPYEEFGLFYKKNGTSEDNVTVFSGKSDITKFGLINRYNGRDNQMHWKTEQCNSLLGSDGSVFPPHMTKDTILHLYDKDLCRLLPLEFVKEVETNGDVLGYRFSPPANVFSTSAVNPENDCYCPHGSPCVPAEGLFNISLCQYDSPVMLSFPHFYGADPKLREAVEGISPPDPELHRMFVDVQPEFGTTLRATARMQMNLAVSQVIDIKQVANFPDIVFPIIWFEDGVDGLPHEVTDLLGLATKIPPIARLVVSYGAIVIGILLAVLALICLVRKSGRQETLNLEGTSHYVKPEKKEKKILDSNGHTNNKNGMEVMNPAFQNDNGTVS